MKNKKKKQRISTIAFAILIKLHHERSFDEVVDVFFFEFEKEFRGKNCHAFSSPLEDEKRREEKKKITLSFTKEIWVKWKRLLLFPIIEECKGGCKPFLSL